MDCPVDGNAVVQPHEPRPENTIPEATTTEDSKFSLDGDHWRREVSVRLQRYRSRRKPREPRYPSLRLPFDYADHWSQSGNSALAVAPMQAESSELEGDRQAETWVEPEQAAVDNRRITAPEENYTNVIEFPRWAAIPVQPGDELAEPIFDRPRIVEAPEMLPPPPALGGILIEPVKREAEKKLVADFALPPSSLPRRLLAGMLDGLVLVGALAAFGGIFYWMDPAIPPKPIFAAAIAIVGTLLWAAYQFLFLVYAGSTPGLRLARLRLTRFDGSPASRSRRRWRVLTSYLSALSLGLGYLWSVLDEDGLCWHDRMTRTYIS
jgi:uncharacterized RDD family membrane protein YckC